MERVLQRLRRFGVEREGRGGQPRQGSAFYSGVLSKRQGVAWGAREGTGTATTEGTEGSWGPGGWDRE